jgi:hypothetical protein
LLTPFVEYCNELANSGLQLSALLSAGFVLSASRGYATIIRLALVMAT